MTTKLSWLSTRWRRLFPFEFGAFGSLFVRREAIELGLRRPVRILYASDLHLGHWWNRGVCDQLVEVCEGVHPDVILLGGDLVDRRSALGTLGKCVQRLSRLAKVAAIPGNHDGPVGIAELRRTIETNNGHWLPAQPLTDPVPIDATNIEDRSSDTKILCAHFPDVFPRAIEMGYRLVLAGHLHGGQCVFATVRDRLYPAVWFHRWHGLRFLERDATLLVSRGVADTFPFRFNCPREVLVCELS